MIRSVGVEFLKVPLSRVTGGLELPPGPTWVCITSTTEAETWILSAGWWLALAVGMRACSPKRLRLAARSAAKPMERECFIASLLLGLGYSAVAGRAHILASSRGQANRVNTYYGE